MKIHQITMTGFGPYRDTETVDFDAFDDDGIFLITGRTGAGKTSILDAITFALFGSIPRYDGTAGEKVRSDYIDSTDTCEVALEFSTGDARYRVTRSPAHQRPKRRGEGTTTEPAGFELARLDGDRWEVIEAKVGNAEVRIEEIVRLNAKQFLQVILLAQGQFQEFLVASSDKRRDLLRMLFDTKRFSDYSEALDARARTLGVQLRTSSTAISTNSASLAREADAPVPETVDLDNGTGVREWVDEVVRQHDAAAAEASDVLRESQTALELARGVLEAARTTRERQDRRSRSRARQVELEAQKATIDTARGRLVEARRAALVWHRFEARRTAERELDEAQVRHRSAEEAFRRVLPDAPTDADALSTQIQRSTELLGTLRDAAQKERSLDRLREAVRTSSAEVADLDMRVEAQIESRQQLRTRLGTLKTSLAGLEKAAAELVTTEHALEALKVRHLAALEAEKTAIEIERAEERRLDAGRAVTAASATRDSLRERQRAGFAGVLAESLVPDAPCAVCGSRAHPAPAVLAHDHVDDAAVEQAEDHYEEVVRTSHEADTTVKELMTRYDHEREAADGRTSEALAAEVESAEQERARAAEATEQLVVAKDTVEQLSTEIDSLSEQIDLAQPRRSALVADQAAATTTYDEVVRSLTAARGTHTSVAERLVDVTAQVGAARALLEATTTLAESVDRVSANEQDLISALAEHEIADIAALKVARLQPHEQAELEAHVNDHDAETKAVASALASEDLSDLPDEPVDTTGPRSAHAEADQTCTRAIGAESAARQKLATINGLAAEIRTALDSSQELHDRYAVLDRLASTVRGQTPNTMKMMLETFVLAAELEEIVLAANTRLRSMTDGRYEFLHSDAMAKGGAQSGLALDVLDAYTGETRAPQSLSGGEKFQASLALALGLAEVLTSRAGGLRLDTLFIDEGFGSLDADTLETTMSTLDNLREGGRTIGLISHVEAMKESIPAQLFVDSTDNGWSTIRTA